MKGIVIGAGEVGTSLYRVLRRKHKTYLVDKDVWYYEGIEVMHICFPYSKYFERYVKGYAKLYEPKYIVVHSTVPVGTCKRLKVFHSPIRGVHPHLEKGIKTFVKYLAPRSKMLKKYFEDAGIKIKNISNTNETEALKLWCTTQYGVFIALQKEIYGWCRENGLNPKIVYKDANSTYNEGYAKLGMKHVLRPVLRPEEGKIGGHCVIQNCDLLKHRITSFIKNENNKF